jgi:hypothetical protein
VRPVSLPTAINQRSPLERLHYFIAQVSVTAAQNGILGPQDMEVGSRTGDPSLRVRPQNPVEQLDHRRHGAHRTTAPV